jgi:hypothetical protein
MSGPRVTCSHLVRTGHTGVLAPAIAVRRPLGTNRRREFARRDVIALTALQ